MQSVSLSGATTSSYSWSGTLLYTHAYKFSEATCNGYTVVVVVVVVFVVVEEL